MENIIDGILLIDKEEGETSFDVVRKVKKCLGLQKVGHAGTLDPFATGLLVVLLGQGTKISRFVMLGKKIYEATVRLGIETDTHDSTGKVVNVKNVNNISRELIEKNIDCFRGEITQKPPVYSALKYKGRRAYELARKGHDVKLEPRKVNVNSIEVLSACLPDITLRIVCSSGTYIRSIAFDLGRILGPGGHLINLRRLGSGCFSVSNAIRSCEIRKGDQKTLLRDNIIPLCDALPDMTNISVNDHIAKRVRQGYHPSWDEINRDGTIAQIRGEYFKLSIGKDLVAIANVRNDGGINHDRIKLERVFF
ncbi:tRNA pseudouridine(55) synthase TruB [Thermodesulfobacteriota bacterium]